MKLSIVIPVYNVEQYIDACLQSVFTQNIPLEWYEVLVINDGSPDGSASIINSYQKRYSNLVLLNQENQGVSNAKNRGLAIAKGKYITFIDPDDVIYPNTLKSIIEQLEQDNLDVLYMGMEAVDTKGTRLPISYTVGTPGIISDGFTHPRRSFIATFYKANRIGTIRFNSAIVIGEDTVFNAMVQSMSEACSASSILYYRYTIRDDSATKNSGTEKVFAGFLQAIVSLEHFKKKYFPNPNLQQQKYFDAVITIFMTRIVELSILPERNEKRFNEVQSVMKELNLNHILDAMSEKFNFLNGSFFMFSAYQKYLVYKQKVYLVAHNFKKRLKK